MIDLSRRAVLAGTVSLVGAGLAGCVGAPQQQRPSFGGTPALEEAPPVVGYGGEASGYGPVTGDKFPIAAVDLSRIDPRFLRQEVDYTGPEMPGTIVVDPKGHHLYLVSEGGRAMRYGVGVGREGFAWSGDATIHSKQEWPDWYPPKEMIQRQPEIRAQLAQLPGGLGVPGGLRNPLGARAMYLWQGNRDTLYRIHGTLEPWTIGTSVSSGCIRLINQDAIDLYGRVPVGTKVVVLS
jgi:lipoprotein-anchoring transpeptidase ErfK/SrfK